MGLWIVFSRCINKKRQPECGESCFGWLAGWLAASAVVLTPERAKREGTLKPMRLPFATTFLTSNNITSPHPTICLLAGNQT
jgi:hypothetical protein